MLTEEGKALLGTPHGIGVAYLVRDHSDVIGRKVPFAHVFTDENAHPPLSDSGGGDNDNGDNGNNGNDSNDNSASNESGSTSSGSGPEEGDDSSNGDNDDDDSSDDGDSSSDSGSSSSASSGPKVYTWNYYIVWELRDTATGDATTARMF